MVSELEARACKHAFMRPAHPLRWGRAVGPLMSWAAFFLFAALGGLAAQKNPNSTASMNTIATPNAITAHLPATFVRSRFDVCTEPAKQLCETERKPPF
jgi:hypothetical protein